jgi:hypothetical protein
MRAASALGTAVVVAEAARSHLAERRAGRNLVEGLPVEGLPVGDRRNRRVAALLVDRNRLGVDSNRLVP